MNYTSLFLDLDDTLLDFLKAEYYAVKDALKCHSLPFDDKTVKLYSQINISFWECFERGEIEKSEIFEGRFCELMQRLGLECNIKSLSDTYCNKLADQSFKIDGAEDLLKYLKSKGYKVYVTTNGSAAIQHKRIKNSGLGVYFDKVFLSEEINFQKPAKEYFDYCINHIEEKDKSKILIIGDSQSSDILGGINSGIDTCWYNPKNKTPKYKSRFEINDLSEIKSIL